ncbi:hypothetical protein OESDEN_19079 [Oesophagostomum dentatum]|uniref:Uncharacterized protein n=1 Tax=Oesophagostomum dentatum TaxID=61180 RepID=A0A0B1SDG0_OESDE|nr:hypothetical protein OESDEN_19079 [Oesophagostomum dentatum]
MPSGKVLLRSFTLNKALPRDWNGTLI